MSDLPPGIPQHGPPQSFPGSPPISVILATLQDLVRATNSQAQIIKGNLGQPASGDLSGTYPGPIFVVSTHLAAPLPIAQGGTGNTTGTTSGPVGGDLSGNLPNPTVARINGVGLGSTTAGAGRLLIGAGAQWVSQPVSGDAALASTGALTLSADIARLSMGQTWSGVQAFNDGDLVLNGSGSGTATLRASAAAGTHDQVFPPVTGTVVMATQTRAANGLFATLLPITSFRNIDGSALAAAASAGKFGYSIVFGTAAGIVGEAAQANTKTDDAMAEVLLPPWYVATSAVSITVNAKLTGAGVAGTHTAQIKAWRTANDGSQGADLGPGVASNITAGGADVAFALTSASLNPGDRILIELETILQETGGAATLTAVINSVRIS